MRGLFAIEAYGAYGTVSLVDPLERRASGYVEVTLIKYDLNQRPVHTTQTRVYFRKDNVTPTSDVIKKQLCEDIMALVEEAVGPLSSASNTRRRVEIGDIRFYGEH